MRSEQTFYLCTAVIKRAHDLIIKKCHKVKFHCNCVKKNPILQRHNASISDLKITFHGCQISQQKYVTHKGALSIETGRILKYS